MSIRGILSNLKNKVAQASSPIDRNNNYVINIEAPDRLKNISLSQARTLLRDNGLNAEGKGHQIFRRVWLFDRVKEVLREFDTANIRKYQ